MRLGRIIPLFFLGLSGWAGTLAQFRTPVGDLDVELFDADKPITVRNFLGYVQAGRYTNTFFHRWVPGFVMQGGGFIVTNRMSANAGFSGIGSFAAITNEFNGDPRFSNKFGTIAMAKLGSDPNSATSQWFFNTADNASNLDFQNGGFTVFGRVIRGTNVLGRFNNTSPTNGIYVDNIGAPFDQLPVLSTSPTFNDLIFVDISLVNVSVTRSNGVQVISWNSVVAKTNMVEYTTLFPPAWQVATNLLGNGARLTVIDPSPVNSKRFYRVRVIY